MESINLLSVCITAFIAVFIVLSLLAIIMRVIIFFFPEKLATDDAAVIAAINTVYHKNYPGTKITKIEELK